MGAPGIAAGIDASPISAVQALLSRPKDSQHASAQHHDLALQIAHNLRFQHGWTELHIHAVQCSGSHARVLSLVSGLPPERLYVHPDEQIDLLQKQKNEGKSGMPQLTAEREWVLPSQLREKWSLRRFGEVFDAVSIVPNAAEGAAIDFGTPVDEAKDEDTSNSWRTTKRVLLATVDDDSTIVYYIVHDGLVKPRQN